MNRVTFPEKAAGETLSLTFDFLSQLAVGETLDSAVTTAEVYSGTDLAPNDLISGAAVVSSFQVRQSIAGGDAGVTYNLICTAVTSEDQTLVQEGYLVVV